MNRITSIRKEFQKRVKRNRRPLYGFSKYFTITYLVLIVSGSLNLLNLTLIDLSNLFYLGLVLDVFSISVFIKYEEQNENALNLIYYLFIFLLIVYAVIGGIGIFSAYNNQIFITIIVLGLLNLQNNKEGINFDLSFNHSSKNNEKLQIISLRELFTNKTYKKIIDKLKNKYTLILLLIFLVFIFIKFPTLKEPLGNMKNGGKFGSYLPTTMNMIKEGNPFVNKNILYSSVFEVAKNSNFEGLFPFYEWGFYPILLLNRFFSIELLLKGSMITLGIIILTLLYLLCKEMLSKEASLIVVFLVGVNQQFHVLTQITVRDVPALIFMLISLNLYIRGRNNLSYIFSGISFIAKYSFALITAPILAVMILAEKDNKLYEFTKLGFFSFLPFALKEAVTDPIPTSGTIEAIIRLLLMPLIIIISYKIISLKDSDIDKFILRINSKIRYSIIFLLPLVAIFLLRDKIISYSDEFITDRYLLFNFNVYSYFLSEKLKDLMLNFFYYLFPLGLIIAIVDKYRSKVSISLLVGGIIYTVVAIKGVWVHTYYKHILVIIPILFTGYIFDQIIKIKEKRASKIIGIAIILTLLFVPSYMNSQYRISRGTDGVKETADYLNSKTEKNEKIIRNAGGRSLYFYGFTNPQIRLVTMNSKALRDNITTKGFGKVMLDNNVKYYVNLGTLRQRDFLKVFTEEGIYYRFESGSRRRSRILREIQDREIKLYNETKIKKLVEKYNPEKFFELEKKIGDYYIYRIIDPNSKD